MPWGWGRGRGSSSGLAETGDRGQSVCSPRDFSLSLYLFYSIVICTLFIFPTLDWLPIQETFLCHYLLCLGGLKGLDVVSPCRGSHEWVVCRGHTGSPSELDWIKSGQQIPGRMVKIISMLLFHVPNYASLQCIELAHKRIETCHDTVPVSQLLI